MRYHRDFPWRGTRDPYAIWVSEIMLQQTRATTVVPYYQRFLRRFPNVQALAQARVEEVLQLWQGLGYYRRALALHEAARILWREYGGQFPRHPDLLQRLPGIGRYTAHAVLSQAFDLPWPVVEANSARVYARLFACPEPLTSSRVQRWLWQVAKRLLPSRWPGLFNQAVMELGATVCLPQQPRCDQCPVATRCQAYRQRRVADYPVPTSPRIIREVAEVAVLIHDGNRWLALQRAPDADRWPCLWEFPHAEIAPREPLVDAARRIAQELTSLCVAPSHCLGQICFTVTRFRIHMTAWCASAQDLEVALSPLHQAARWLPLRQLRRFAWSTPHRRLLTLLDNWPEPPRSPITST